MKTKQWKVGDEYYQANAELHGNPWDIGELGEACETEAEAKENADLWLGDLSPRERQSASARVGKYRVLALDADGSIGVSVSVMAISYNRD